jgi:hypothetical protein
MEFLTLKFLKVFLPKIGYSLIFVLGAFALLFMFMIYSQRANRGIK